MKQSAARTLGVAALGAAFAAAAAGTASAAVLPGGAAATTVLPVAGAALDTATRTLPAEDVTTTLLGKGQQKLVGGATGTAKGLLGGLPAGGGLNANGLTANGLSTSTLPLGG
ncbi:hypothetical protein ABZZ04_13805 [Streptomyces sp. NPDC006435]|uniref:hypothetical protein n=1 Tax=Streptomyces sp. NPDC006435 TaxID=3154300 RepID=UPI0033A149F6